jgi:hypothetical protein
MEYTLEQKALAAIRGDLWWRLPNPEFADDANWSLLHEDVVGIELNDLQKPRFVYYIGPKAPPILSELEAELMAALEQIAAISNKDTGMDWDEIDEARAIARAAIKKTRGEA